MTYPASISSESREIKNEQRRSRRPYHLHFLLELVTFAEGTVAYLRAVVVDRVDRVVEAFRNFRTVVHAQADKGEDTEWGVEA